MTVYIVLIGVRCSSLANIFRRVYLCPNAQQALIHSPVAEGGIMHGMQ
jgi:hypothetical protein